MEAADQEVVQPARPSELASCATVGVPDNMSRAIYEVPCSPALCPCTHLQAPKGALNAQY